MTTGSTILVVDDERLVRWAISQRLAELGYRVEEAADARSARTLAADADLLIIDHGLPDATGFELMEQLRADAINVPVLVLTGSASVARAVEAMKRGAWYCVAKPVDLDHLAMLVERCVQMGKLREQVLASRRREGAAHSFERIVGQSPAMRVTKRQLQKIAASSATTILLTGESGTGRDLAARVMHHGSSRAAQPFASIVCSAFQDTFLQSELFGRARGAGTAAGPTKKGLLELADGGTVFLDGIAETSALMQAKLSRFLEERTFNRLGGERDIRVDVRVIVATDRDLGALVAEGQFCEELLGRLRVLPIDLPPLRHRDDDIMLLAQFFLDDFARRFGRSQLTIDEPARHQLLSYHWPGNVRELKNAVERAALLADADCLRAADFVLPVNRPAQERDYLPLPADGIDLESVERGFVQQALERTGGNRTHAARLLGLNRDQVRYRVDKFKL